MKRTLLVLVAALAAMLGGPTRASAQHLERLELAHGAFVRSDAPEAIASVPDGVDATRPISLVLFLHGYSGCVEVIASDAPDARCRPRDRPTQGWGLVRAHTDAGLRSVLLVPQLVFMQRSGRAGRFGHEGEAARFVHEALARLAPRLGRTATLADVESITILAHSAAYETTLALLRHGGLGARVRHVVLFDALYAGRSAFLDWIAGATQAEPRTLVLYATGGQTLTESRALFASAHRRWPASALEEPDFTQPLPTRSPRLVVLRRARVPHGSVPITYLAETLRALGLPRR